MLTSEQLEILGHMDIVYLDDGQGGLTKTIEIHGVNVRIVDGSGTTDGTPTGLGNLIVGYNELRGSDDDRTGSHNMVAGTEHNYTRVGGLVTPSPLSCHPTTGSSPSCVPQKTASSCLASS